ncbi:MAG: hypothetical protein IID08_09080 [Candidatus Hydrogenedentes bacterium]|nr:hypothetical protein [Candidatus Hydrogenedentota bacterium]
MAFEYHWWDLEESKFKGVLYNTIGGFWLSDHPYKTWEEFEEDVPHIAFTDLVCGRLEALEQLFVDLRVVVQMLGVTDVPVKSATKNINRYDWLKSALDLKLLRYASIRDVSFHLVNEVFGLEIEDRKLNIQNIKKALANSRTDLTDVLDRICTAGSEIRKERNTRAHVGFAQLGTEDDNLFRIMSWSEDADSVLMDYDIDAVYQEACERMYKRLVKETDDLLATVICLVDELIPDFDSMYEKKRLKKKN